MKIIKTGLLLCALLFTMNALEAQDVQGDASDFAILKGEKSINIEFTYEKVSVGEYAKESEYIKKKTDEMNAKEAGSGDEWAKKWEAAKKEHYEPRFIELFTKKSDMTIDSTAKYTIIFKTTFIEPGYQIAISKKSAQVEGQIFLVKTANKTKKLSTLTVEKDKGKFRGGSFDFAGRIAEAYAVTGRELGELVKKGTK